MPLPRINTNLILAGVIIATGILGSYLILAQAQAQIDSNNISFPVKELGNCKDKADCENYCNKQENVPTCVSFAEKHGLISADEAAKAKAFAQQGEGPGGCKTKDQCENYCNDNTHLDECLSFAEKHNLLSKDDLEEAQKVAQALKQGAQLPGGCRNKQECENYCNDNTHLNECVAFAEKSGIIPRQELEQAKQVAKVLAEGGSLPGNCKNKGDCDVYCSDPNHADECLNFALKAGFISKDEAEQARKVIPLMQKGETPGGCKTKDQCENYCNDSAHADECANFALKAGFMKPEEAEIFKKTGGKGPGGCKGKEECETFCNNPQNQEACFKFAEEHNLIPAEEVQKMKEGMNQMRQGLESAPSEVKNCLEQTVGTEILEKIRAGTLTPGPQIGDQVKNCFEKFVPQEMMRPGGPERTPGGPEGGHQGQFRGPGGCSSPDECTKFCSDPSHKEECSKFGGNQGPRPIMPQGMQLPEGMRPPEGMMQPPPGQNIPEKYKQMMPTGPEMPGQPLQQNFQYPGGGYIPQQYQQYQGMTPPQGMEQIQSQQLQQQYIAPPPPTKTPPPSETPPPPQSLLKYSPFGFLLRAFLGQ